MSDEPKMTADYCVCGGTRDQPNPDCERCQLLATIEQQAAEINRLRGKQERKELAHHSRYVEEVAKAANDAFDLDGCCHWETVCEAIRNSKAQLANERGVKEQFKAALARQEALESQLAQPPAP